MSERGRFERRTQVACGAVAGPLFLAASTAIGATRPGYDWRSASVSSLALGRRGWLQRGNFMVAGVLYSCAALGLRRCDRRTVGPPAVPVLVGLVGLGLVGSGVFVTDSVGGFRPATPDDGGADEHVPVAAAPTREGKLHNICAVPVFAGIPLAGLVAAVVAATSEDPCWASYSAGSSLVMAGSYLAFGRAFGGRPPLADKGGMLQRISITSGFGWLTALSLRALASMRRV